jgi:maltooligosyltrehalose trehalohydrolase
VDYRAHQSLDDPGDENTFTRCKLDFAEREINEGAYSLHRDLLRLRRDTAAFRDQRRGGVDGAVLSSSAFVLRYFTEEIADARALIVNFGADLNRPSFPEPLLAPPADRDWVVQWSSEDPRYGGRGLSELRGASGWCVSAESAIVLAPGPKRPGPPPKVRRRTA